MLVQPFKKSDGGTLNPEETRVIGEAFDAACMLLGRISDTSRSAVADKIMDAAANGERDLIRLRDAGMDALRSKRR